MSMPPVVFLYQGRRLAYVATKSDNQDLESRTNI
jgi:hypothetical protein